MKLNRFICGLTLVGVAGFYSCTSDENLMSDSSVNGKQVPLTITVNRGDVTTRTELSENTEGGLDDKWLAKEVLQVYDALGKNVGELVQKDGYENSPRAVFSGTVTVADGNSGGDYCIWYFGQPVENENGTLSHPYITCKDGVATVNLGNQSFKSAKDLSVLDVMYQNIAITVSGGEAFVDADVTMTPVFAMARFSLTGLSDGESGNLVIKDVSASSDNSNATSDGNVKYNLATGEHVASDNATAMSISVEGVEDGKDVYVALFPKAYTLGFTFTGTSGYTAQITSKELEAGKYYCALPGEGETGLSGIKVEMTKTGGSEDDPYKEYANEDPRNPLHKFAKYNLVRVGDRGSLVNGFADSETENGALYQWGRNYGYMDNKGVYGNSSLPLYLNNDDFINYADAQGDMTYNLEKGESFADFYVYQADQEKSQDFYLTTGMSAHYNSSNGVFFDRPHTYATLEDLRNNPTKYFMNATMKSVFKSGGTLALMYENGECVEDYWLSTFTEDGKEVDGGKTWSERASVSGYQNTNPCPQGWRLPSLAEMRAIAPAGNGIDQKTTLQDALAKINSGKVRKYEGVTYAIRWVYNEDYLQIECVVDDNLTDDSDLTDLYWDNHSKDKVVRKFPYTGAIAPLNIQYAGVYLDHYQQIVRPYFRGVSLAHYNYDYGLLTIFPNYDIQYIMNKPNDSQNTNGAFGGYWVEEINYAFKFVAGEKYGTSVEDCCLFVGSAEPVMGYAIRPVMDK